MVLKVALWNTHANYPVQKPKMVYGTDLVECLVLFASNKMIIVLKDLLQINLIKQLLKEAVISVPNLKLN
jgi:hypothetical protein